MTHNKRAAEHEPPALDLLRAEARRLGWPIVNRRDLAIDGATLARSSSVLPHGFGWMLHECGTYLIDPERWSRVELILVAALYPGARFYFCDHVRLTPCSSRELIRRVSRAPIGHAREETTPCPAPTT